MQKYHLPLVALLFLITNAHAADPDASSNAISSLKQYLDHPAASRPALADQPFATTPLTREDAATAQSLLWSDRAVQLKQERAAEVQARVLKDTQNPALEMPFFYTVFGDKPKNGRSLFISMHGGGNAPKSLNDSQWENQKKLYKPDEGVYLAPRAPTNTWNLWHEPHIDRLFARLIEDMILFEDVDPNRVYLMGYSAGGDGVYQLAPRMADQLAAASMMAGHPNDASPLGLRNLPFSIHVGALDNGFDRNKVAMEWEAKLANLRKDDLEGYIHWVKLYDGKPHWMDRQDAAAVPWMMQYTRNPFPMKIVWQQGHAPHTRFYWLVVDEKSTAHGTLITATRKGQEIRITTKDVAALTVRLNDLMFDLDQPITITANGDKVFQGTPTRTISTLRETLVERADPVSQFAAEVRIRNISPG